MHYMNKNALVPNYIDETLEYSEENFDGLLSEARALKNRHMDVYNICKKV